MNLSEVAAELYQLAPETFTAARNARAKAIAAAGDRELAASVRSLPKPAASAWVLNRLSAENSSDAHDIAQLGAALRHAQQNPQRQTLSDLGEQRRALVNRVAATASRLAEENGVNLSAAALSDMQQTLFAAVADAHAAAAVFSGRLLRPLQSVGLDEVDLSDAVAGAEPRPIEVSGASGAATRTDARETRDAAASKATARERREAEKAVRAAEDAAERAAEAVEALEDAVRAHAREVDHLESDLEEAHATLIRLEHRQSQLAAHERELQHERTAALGASERAQREAEAARARLTALDDTD